ncbi:homocysteine-responsive endoplasmic reticulum-resident ubiquitin-like domain member 2 protein [Drosophila guanche]|uniref:Blast:Homocysteine-responsive endoplasmic reticulum-resident ubiquitin-like domain member 1 protein n=1 Tax=Drosophila guanche TaxID=7266 RepID=A0A3B0JBB0_DROGU|nr:homocysteine-responsive endoplasmic reticulum-resident ubiquitin-like domain member 2 protein [Drosophila guanche]SPP79637.1 blast:Homocysteine-responsive endoplasmic reticulum-resident ubiquitin-like domain member 1 protein [Drosophila guanche]
MDDTAASPAAATAAGCDAARDKTTNAGVAVAAAASSTSVRLLIKSSNQQYDDMNVDSDLSWTVQRLKKQLSLVYPGKPDINDQKLIYSGKLLDDAQKLSEVIRSYKDVYQQHHIFHLVCASKHFPKPPAMPTVVPKSATAPRQEANANELRQRHATNQQQQQQPPLELPQQQANSVDSDENLAIRTWYALWLRQQQTAIHTDPHVAYQQQALLYNAWMSQVYDRYLQDLMRGAESPPGNRVPLLPNMLPQWELDARQRVAGAAAVAVGVQLNQAQPVAQPAAAAVPPVPNRPNFPLIQEEPENRDWLDSFFSFTRLALFVTVLYFNSSPLRCLLVMLIAGVIYLYHIGVLRRRRERNNNNINRNNNAGNAAAAFAAVQQIQRMMDAVERENNDPQAAVEPAVGAGQDAPGAAVADAAPAPAAAAAAPAAAAVPATAAGPEQAAAVSAEAAAVEPPNANNSVISVVRTFVITFFTSLLPEAPAL